VAEHQLLFNGQTLSVTVSIGVSSYKGQTADELIQQADMALYNAKRQGRNRVVAWQEPAEVYLKQVK
jgi:diguanylate cyclase (GGDEF)-like protein